MISLTQIKPNNIAELKYLPGTCDLFHTNAARTRVAIVGAGLSAAVAAYQLSKQGFDTLLIERDEHVGGRFHSIALGNDETIEAGGMRISDQHILMANYIGIAGLTHNITDFTNDSPHTLLKREGIVVRKGDYQQLAQALGLPLEFGGLDPRAYFNDRMLRVVNELRNQQSHMGAMGAIEQALVDGHEYGYLSLNEFLQKDKRNQREIEWIAWINGVEPYLNTPVGETAVDFFSLYGGEHYYTLKAGLQQLPAKLIEKSGAQLMLGSQVTDVIVRDNGVILHMVGPEGPTQIAVDQIVLTCPPPVLNGIRFDPPLPCDQAKAFDSITYAKSSKTIIKVSHPFWMDDGICGGTTWTDDILQQVVYPSRAYPGKPSAFTATYSWEENARRLQNMSTQQRNARIIATLETLHPGCSQFFREIYHYDWDRILGYGAFAYYHAGDYQHHHPRLSQPFPCQKPRVFFASEASSLHHGWGEGACASAQGAVMQLMSSL